MANQIVTDETVQEFFNFLKTRLNNIGDLSGLKTTAKNNIVAAVNEILANAGTLSSLKTTTKDSIANAINELVERTQILTYNNAAAHNSLCRGKYLGTAITAEHYAAIRSGKFDDLYVGDYWVLPINGKSVKATIAGFCCGWQENFHIVLLLNNLGNFPINDTATCEGHLANSKLQTEIIPSLLEKIHPVIPEEHIMNVREYVADAINSAGEITHYTYMQLKLFLPSRNNFGGLAWHPFTPYGLRTKDYRLNTAYISMSSVRWPLAQYEKKSYLFYQCWLAENFNATEWTYGSDDYFWGYSSPANSLKGNTGRDLKFSPYMFLA